MSDPLDKKHIIRLLGSFEYRKHLCLVFESLDIDMRCLIKMYGKTEGLSLEAVRSYARQIFLGLNHLKKNKLIHADREFSLAVLRNLVKPDNIVVSKNRKIIKICDLNSAIPIDESIISEDVVSRFYRAPEIILGCPFGTQIDIWAAGCTLFEIYTGQFLFPGYSNNQMLKLMMQAKGKFSNKYLRRGSFTSKHFDDDYNFLSHEIDPISREVNFCPANLLGICQDPAYRGEAN